VHCPSGHLVKFQDGLFARADVLGIQAALGANECQKELEMQNRSRIVFGMTLVALMAVPLHAYQLALKDGHTIQFQKYRATETMLFYTGGDGKEVAIPLKDVDLGRTQNLNTKEPVPLDLPGLTPPGGSSGSEPSLADLARKSRKDVAAAAAKRVLTDDDVPHSILTPSPSVATAEPTQSAPPDDIKMDIEPAQKIAERFANKSQSQLANEAAGDVKFPDRDAWEQKLYGQAQ
jgi:hypothetical protein